MSTTPIHTFKVADSPFDDTDAEIVLRSSDNVDFYVHKWPLSRASSVFKDMFSIPSPNNPSNADELKDGIPIVHMTENSAVLDTILRLSYPTDKPSISSELSFVRALSEAMDKYAMIKTFPQTLESIMLEAAAVRPFAVYAIACHYQMFEVANRIARITLRLPLDLSAEYVSKEDLDSMTTSQYHQLLRYHQQSSRAAIKPICSLEWLTPLQIPGVFLTPRKKCCCSSVYKATRNFTTLSGRIVLGADVPSWIVQYMERCEAALVSTPHSDIILTDSFISPSVRAAAQCPVCQMFEERIREYANRVKAEVDLAIDGVSFILSFPLNPLHKKVGLNQVPLPFPNTVSDGEEADSPEGS